MRRCASLPEGYFLNLDNFYVSVAIARRLCGGLDVFVYVGADVAYFQVLGFEALTEHESAAVAFSVDEPVVAVDGAAGVFLHDVDEKLISTIVSGEMPHSFFHNSLLIAELQFCKLKNSIPDY